MLIIIVRDLVIPNTYTHTLTFDHTMGPLKSQTRRNMDEPNCVCWSNKTTLKMLCFPDVKICDPIICESAHRQKHRINIAVDHHDRHLRSTSTYSNRENMLDTLNAKSTSNRTGSITTSHNRLWGVVALNYDQIPVGVWLSVGDAIREASSPASLNASR